MQGGYLGVEIDGWASVLRGNLVVALMLAKLHLEVVRQWQGEVMW